MNAGPAIAIDTEAFTEWVRSASDEHLREIMLADRDAVLGEIFARMGNHFDPVAARELSTVIEWRILEGEDGGFDRFQARIDAGRCEVCRGGDLSPKLTVTIRPTEFLRVVTGNISGKRLFMLRRVKIDGDLMLAGRLARLFRIPEAGSDG